MIGVLTKIKNYVMAFLAIFAGGYVIKQKYDIYKTEKKLKDIGKSISEANIKVIKENAKESHAIDYIEKESLENSVKELIKSEKKISEDLMELRKNEKRDKRKKIII